MSDNQKYILSIGVAHEMAQTASEEQDYQLMRDIWDAIDADPSIIGDRNDYHNLAVVYSRDDDYLTAYKVTVRGLQQFPFNTDLLADAIYYGSNCQKYEECRKHMTVLLQRPRASWTWRAFSFLIDYLKDCWDWEKNVDTIEGLLDNALSISREYQKYIPNQERGYVAEYEVLINMSKLAIEKGDEKKAQKLKKESLELLKNVIYSGKIAAVQCALRYIDIMFESQKFQDVIDIANQALRFGQATPTVRLGYFMYLSAQAREMLLYEEENWQSKTDTINYIYAEYFAATSSNVDKMYRNNIKNRVSILVARSSVPAPQGL